VAVHRAIEETKTLIAFGWYTSLPWFTGHTADLTTSNQQNGYDFANGKHILIS
jgi:hypothetical protein